MAMDQEVGELAVRLEAVTRDFQEAIKGAEARIGQLEKVSERKTKGVSKVFRKMGSTVKKQLLGIAAGFAAYAGARGIAGAVKSNLDFLDSLDKASSKLGVSTGYLQQASYAASQSGVRYETLTMAMQRFTRRAGEAAQGTGEAKDAIRELGIGLTDSQGTMRTTEDLFSDAMRALARIDDPANRLRLAFKLFDSEGAVLVNMAENFETLSDKAQAMGLVVDESVIRAGVKAKDELETLSKVIQVSLAPALVELTPLLENVAEQLVLVSGFAADVWNWFSDIANLPPTGIEDTKDRIDELNTAIADLESRIGTVDVKGKVATTIVSTMLGPLGQIKALREKITSLSGVETGDLRRKLVLLEIERDMLEAQLRSRERLKAAGEAPIGGAGGAGVPAAVTPEQRQRLMKAAEEMIKSSIPAEELSRTISARFRAAAGLPAPELETLPAWGARVREEGGIPPETEEEGSQFAQRLGQEMHGKVKWALVDGLKSGEFEAEAVLSDLGDTMSERFLERGVEDMLGGLEEGFGEMFEGFGPKLSEVFGGIDLGPMSSAVSGALSAAAGIGLAMVVNAIGGTKARQTFADIQRASGVTETREMRGIVAGGPSVAIAEVGGAIADAFVEPTTILREQLRVQLGILAALGGGGRGGGAIESEATAMLQASTTLY